MRFEHPTILWLLPAVIPALLLFFWWTWRTRQRLLGQFVAARLLPGLTASVAPSRKKLKLALLGAAVPVLLIALARPQIGFTWEEARSKGLDIIVAIDTSKSMLANDLAPSRLKRAKLAALDLRQVAGADRLGLVAFAGSSFLQCPLSLDDEAFRQSVEILDVNIIPQGGTALSEAILSAQAAFKDKSDSHKVLVIFTDGEDHDGTAIETAKAAAKEGLRIFTIGAGTPNGELIRLTDVQGRVEFLKDESGNAVKSRLNEDLLRQIAESTGGFYMRLSGANTMKQLYENGLSRLPKSDLASQRIRRYHERYQWLLGLVIVLLLAEMFVPERKKRETRSGNGAMAKAAALVLGATLALGFPLEARASAGKGLKQFKNGKFDEALQQYEDALEKRPDDPSLRFNAGTAAFQAGRLQKAYEHLNSALVTPDLKLQQRAYYNLGNTNFRLGEDADEPEKTMGLWEQAIKNFDAALKLDPTDADASYNKELVQKKLEELKKQQQQEKKDQNKDDQKDENQKDQQDQQKQDQQKQDQQSKDQQNQKQDQQSQKDQQDQQKDSQKQDSQQQQKQPDDQKQQQQQSSSGKEDQEKKDQQAQQGQPQKPEDQEGNPDGQPQGTATLRMTPQQAVRLLEALKSEEQTLQFRPILRTNRTDRILKDW